MDVKKDILKRVYIVYFIICLFGLAVISRVVMIQFVNGDEWREKAQRATTMYRNIEAVRGNIYASDGTLLATSIPIYEVRWDPNADAITKTIFEDNLDSLSIRLGQMFSHKPAWQWKEELEHAREKGSRYHLIARKVKYNQLKELRQFPLFRKGRFKGGLIYMQQTRRERPFRMLAARTIGYDRDDAKVGLEGAYSDLLGGVSGKRLMQKIAGGVYKPLNDNNEIEPVDGSHLYTSIDINIQDVAENALLKQLQLHDAHHGCVVLMEVETGEIKAIANLSKGEDGEHYEHYNYAIGESTVPGSTIKLASYLVALEDGIIDINDSIDTGNGIYKIYDERVEDTKKGGYGMLSVKQAFAYSSNVAIVKTIHENYSADPQKYIDRLHKLGISEPLGIEIRGEGEPLIKNVGAAGWSGISLPWMAYGYEMNMTPLQILTLYNAVANDGRMVKPKFVREVWDKGSLVESMPTQVINPRICSEQTLGDLREMLESVVEEGTAKNLRGAHYKIAGKTGTAQIANAESAYSNKAKISYQASFAGYFPADDPKYSCIVVVNAPSRQVYYGNIVAGPVFKEIADKVYASSIEIHDEVSSDLLADLTRTPIPVSKNGYREDLQTVFGALDVPVKDNPPASDWVVTQTGEEDVKLDIRSVREGQVPNVLGMAAQDAVYLLENRGLFVSLTGRGTIKKQSITPGSELIVGSGIILELDL